MLPDILPYLREDNTPSECIKRCRDENKGYVFAGVQYAFQCFCGHVAPTSDLILDESQCNMECSGNDNFVCGGSWKMNVYEIGEISFFFFTFALLEKWQRIVLRVSPSK